MSHGSRRTTTSTHEETALGRAYDGRLMRKLWPFVRPHRALVLLSLLLLVAVSAVQIAQPYIVKVAIDEYILTRRAEGLIALAGLFLCTLIAEFLLRFAQLYVMEKTGQNVVYDLRTAVFGHLQRLPSSFFDKNPVGRLMTRVTSDIESLNEAFTSGLVLILADLVKLVGIVAILLWMDWRLALVTCAIVPLMIAVTWWFRVRMRAAYREVRRKVAQLNAFLQENVSGMRLIQLFGREQDNLDQFDAINRQHRDAELTGVRYESAFSAIAEMLGSITLAAILWASGWRILAGATTFGTLVAFIEYASKFFQPVQQLSQRYAVMQAAMASSERIFALLDTDVVIRSPQRPRRLEHRPRGEIGFESVTFGYAPGEPVLSDVTFRINPGERIAVVGWTGSGKSTLIRLLVRLYDVWDGRITLDGTDVREYELADLRRAVGVVLQEPFLFADTLGGNISLGDPRIDDQTVRAAARAVRADRFIEAMPAGYRAPVLERGANLSVGEKQLLTFARALAFDPAVLVLDEATASVDPETEGAIEKALDTLLTDRTSIIIAHRLATVRRADRILVLHQGRLREQGNHTELMRHEGGIYRALYDLQTAGLADV
ncbi:MAG: ABC transporter ATP-binding protein [Acidobacteriota bacterium]|nr:MAG: ABC transporter ATP-binding protein [Acidobacteriota bacterium]